MEDAEGYGSIVSESGTGIFEGLGKQFAKVHLRILISAVRNGIATKQTSCWGMA